MKQWIKKNYQQSFATIHKARWHIVTGLSLFCLAIIVGFGWPVFFEGKILLFLKGLISTFEGKGVIQTAIHIFFNNVNASFFAMILGIGFGIFPIGIAIVNGYMIGFVARLVVKVGQTDSLWQLLPHGIFELPAVIMSIGLGMYLGHEFFKQRKTNHKHFKKEIINLFKTFVFIIIPLLIIAALVEALLIFYMPIT